MARSFEERDYPCLSAEPLSVEGSLQPGGHDQGQPASLPGSLWFQAPVLGKLGSGYVVASETCAFDLLGADSEGSRTGGVADYKQRGIEKYKICQ